MIVLSCLYPQLMSERDELAATVDRLQTDRDHLAESHSSTSTDLSDRQSEIHDLCEQVSQRYTTSANRSVRAKCCIK